MIFVDENQCRSVGIHINVFEFLDDLSIKYFAKKYLIENMETEIIKFIDEINFPGRDVMVLYMISNSEPNYYLCIIICSHKFNTWCSLVKLIKRYYVWQPKIIK